MMSGMTKADDYRKRAAATGKRASKNSKSARQPMLKKQKALNDMADNEDWLDGKIKKPKPKAP
jgi:hypothetical protein